MEMSTNKHDPVVVMPAKQSFIKVLLQRSKASFKHWHTNEKLTVAVLVSVVIIGAGIGLLGTHHRHTKQTISSNPVIHSYQQQLPKLAQTVKDKPTDVQARTAYAAALYVTGQKTAARDQYIVAAKLDPTDAMIQNNLGNTYRDLNAPDLAIAAYKRAIQINPGNQNAYVNLANVQLYSQHKAADAIATYQQAITKIGKTSQLQLLLAIAYEQAGQIDTAKQTYQSILTSDPSNQAAKDNLSRLK